MPSSARRLLVVFGIVFLLSAGCGGTTEEGEELETMQLAFSHPTIFTTGMPFYVAQDQGFYEEAGLEVDPVFTDGGAAGVQAVVAGDAAISTELGGSSVLGAYSEGAPVRIIAPSTTGLDLFWFSKADSPYEDGEDLAGQQVGYSSIGASSHIGVLALNDSLVQQGLEEVEAESIGGPPDQFTAVQTDQIAAGWSQPPFFLNEIEEGELDIVAQGDELAEYQDVAVRVIIANAREAEQNPEQISAFLEAHGNTWDWIFENQEEAVSIWREAAELEDDVETLMTSFDFYERENFRLAPIGGRDTIVEDAERLGFVEEELTEEQLDEVFDTSYVPNGQ